MLKDLQHGIRTLAHAKGWTAVVVLSLALGIGANVAIFSSLNGLLLTQVPVKDAKTLVRLRWVGRNDMVTNSTDYGPIDRARYGGENARVTFSYPMFEQLRVANRTMQDLFACAPFVANVVVDGEATITTVFLSTGNYYRVLGVSARLGRTIVPDDDRADAPAVAVISSQYWHSRFGSDASVVGKTIHVNGTPVTIAGVLPPDFTGIQQPIAEAPDISLPLSLEPRLETYAGPPQLVQPTFWWLQIMGRVKPGVTPAQVQGDLDGVFQSTARAGLDTYMQGLTGAEKNASSNRDRTRVPRLIAEPGDRGLYDVNARDLQSAAILSAVVVLVLLIVCANVANLLLSRATTRQKEISVRLALGATRGRLVRQLLTESLLLAAMGGMLGIAVGYWGRLLLPGPIEQKPMVDWRLYGFVAGVTLLTGVVFGIVPALRGTAVNLNATLKATSRSVVASRSVLGRALLIVQIAISLVLLVGAGLFLQTLSHLRHVDVGFDPQNLVLFRANPSFNRYDRSQKRLLYTQMLDRIAALPGIRGVAMSDNALLSGHVNARSIYVEGEPAPLVPPQDDQRSINRLIISPNFFDVMGIRLVVGRALTDRDTDTSLKVTVINEAAARRYFPNQNPIGRHFGSTPETTGDVEVVGVLRDAKYDSVREDAPPTMYVPFAQTGFGEAVFEVRTAGPALAATMGSIREIVRQIDPTLPLTNVSTQLEQVEKGLLQEKLFAQAYTLFGALALVLASIGLFGLMSYNVSRRTNEIGIRMALGAPGAAVLGLVMRESMLLVAIGAALGLLAALAASRLLTTLLFGLAPRDPVTMIGATVVLAAVSALAAFLPARRASKVDPMVSLHHE